MINTDKLYQAFGQLLYAISRADGHIQNSEKEAIVQALHNHDMANVILASMKNMEEANIRVDEAFINAITTLKTHGPFHEYGFFYEILLNVANSYSGIDSNESLLLNIFNKEFLPE